jgi:hypothetical protein
MLRFIEDEVLQEYDMRHVIWEVTLKYMIQKPIGHCFPTGTSEKKLKKHTNFSLLFGVLLSLPCFADEALYDPVLRPGAAFFRVLSLSDDIVVLKAGSDILLDSEPLLLQKNQVTSLFSVKSPNGLSLIIGATAR